MEEERKRVEEERKEERAAAAEKLAQGAFMRSSLLRTILGCGCGWGAVGVGWVGGVGR